MRWYHKIGEVAKDLVAEDSWFADFGLLTVGPVDGHDLPKLESVLREVAKADRPIVLHVHTVKGKVLSMPKATPPNSTRHRPFK